MPKSIKVTFLPSWNPLLKPAGPENTFPYIPDQFSARLGLATSSGPPVYMKLGLQQDRAKPNTGPDQCTLSSSPAYSLLHGLVASGSTPSCHIPTTTSTCEKRCSGLLGGISETFLNAFYQRRLRSSPSVCVMERCDAQDAGKPKWLQTASVVCQ
jgi:hypothetical protein